METVEQSDKEQGAQDRPPVASPEAVQDVRRGHGSIDVPVLFLLPQIQNKSLAESVVSSIC